MLTVGKWSKLHFVDSSFEMDYLKEYLRGNDNPNDAKIDLHAPDQPLNTADFPS